MPGQSSITTPVSGRIAIDDAEVLRRTAERDGITVSELLKRLMREIAPRLA